MAPNVDIISSALANHNDDHLNKHQHFDMLADETMMRNSNNKWSSKSFKSAGPSSPWIHPPGALQGAHVAYLVKFLGCTEVDSAKGIEVVKAGIQKMRFNSHVKRAEGSKIPKVELTISIDGVAIQEPKTKKILYQYPLYRISYCADDKAEKRFFCFIAKEEQQHPNVPADQPLQHRCFVFVSDKLAENITLTIGQAFDLAYRRYLETSGRELEMRKQILILQKRAKLLERENSDLKQRINELESGTTTNIRNHVDHNNNIVILKPDSFDQQPSISLHSLHLNGHSNGHHTSTITTNGNISTNGLNGHVTYGSSQSTSVTTQHRQQLENIAPPPPVPPRPRNADDNINGSNATKNDLITLDPFAVTLTPEEDPFGDFQKLFSSNGHATTAKQYDDAIGKVDKRISEMREGFSQGLSFGKDDFTLDAFDPLSKNSTTSHA